MEQNSASARLHSLDGVRGLAIIFVILNHVNPSFVAPFLPGLLSQVIFASGVTGVSLLFVLSGFFMAYIYPHPASASQFLQKRYTRIFPLFITMCAVMLVFRIYPTLIWYAQLLIIFSFAAITHVIWVYLIKRYASISLRRLIFITFLVLQVITGLFYLLFVMRQPAIVFNQQLPSTIREGTIGLVNATLTLPFGDYIPMLDGVYWSLVAEVLFYVLYPVLCVPFIKSLIPKKRFIKIAALLFLIPFFLGLDILAHKIWVVSILQIQICFYFVMGIVLGYLFRSKTSWIESLSNFFSGKIYYASIGIFFVTVLGKTISFNYFQRIFDPVIHILWAFPITLVLAIALSHKTALAKLLQSRLLIFLGTISYSMYLVHTPIIHLVEHMIPSKDILTNVISIVLTVTLTTLVATALYFLLEKPYFLRTKSTSLLKKENNKKSLFINLKILLPLLIIVSFASIFSAYQSKFNFFSVMRPLSSTSSTGTSVISMNTVPHVTFEFISPDDQLNIVTTNLKYHFKELSATSSPLLIFHIKEVGTKEWYATNTYKAADIGTSEYHPLGFPPIINALNKKYIVDLELVNGTPTEYLTIDTAKTTGVFTVNKSELFRNPNKLLAFIVSRLSTVLLNREAKYVFLLLVPTFLLFSYIVVRSKD